MPIVDLQTITVPQRRIRTEFPEEKENELIASILSKGLLHPPVVDKEGVLLAGERRLRALRAIADRGLDHKCNGKTLRPGLIFVTEIHQLSKADRLEAELEENTVRLDVTWQDKAAATDALHRLRSMQAQERGEAPPTAKDIAAEVSGRPIESTPETSLRRPTQDVEKDLLVAAWGQDEEVMRAPSRADALKIIERKLREGHRAALAREFLKNGSASEHKAIHGDCVEILPTLPANHFDCIIADPPYGINADGFTNQAAVGHDYADDMNTFMRIHHAIATEGMRITKGKAHAYIFGDVRRFPVVSDIFKRAGWYVWSTPLIWYKGSNVGIAPRPSHGPRRTYECITYCIKGDREVTGIFPDVLVIPHDRSVERGAHKPPALYAELFCRSCLPGDRVIDPCCGSGPVFDAANQLKLIATGIELEEGGFGEAVKRLNREAERKDKGGRSEDDVTSDEEEWEEV